MSSLPLAFAPLPFDANPGAAFNDELTIPSVPGFITSGAFYHLTVPGEYFYYPLSCRGHLQTDATAAQRSAYYLIVDANGGQVIVQPLSATLPPSGVYGLDWQISVGAAYADGNNTLSAPLPPRLLPPGYQVGILLGNFGNSDSMSGNLSVIKIPRQRPVAQAAPLAVTPIIV